MLYLDSLSIYCSRTFLLHINSCFFLFHKPALWIDSCKFITRGLNWVSKGHALGKQSHFIILYNIILVVNLFLMATFIDARPNMLNTQAIYQRRLRKGGNKSYGEYNPAKVTLEAPFTQEDISFWASPFAWILIQNYTISWLCHNFRQVLLTVGTYLVALHFSSTKISTKETNGPLWITSWLIHLQCQFINKKLLNFVAERRLKLHNQRTTPGHLQVAK